MNIKFRFALLLAISISTGCGSDGGSRGGGGVTSQKLCMDSCPIRCGADRDCDTPGGELCCDLGEGGQICTQASACPRFCSADSRCDTARGEGCVRPGLASQQKICAQPEAGIRKCAMDNQCRTGEVCCGIYSEAVCVPAAACPKACAQSSQCNTGQGEICCTSLPKEKLSLSAAGLCVFAQGCPKACASSADCAGTAAQICCNGLCSTSCPKSCSQSSDCDRQICCDVGFANFVGRGIPTLPAGSVGTTTGGTVMNGETCQTTTCPQGSGSYKFCSTMGASSCRYIVGVGTSFQCASCSNCSGALMQVTNWCASNGGVPLKGCNGYLMCLADTNTTQQECDDGSTDRAKDLLLAVDECLNQTCFTGTTPACTSNTDTSTACNNCINQAVASGGACFSQIQQCRADRP